MQELRHTLVIFFTLFISALPVVHRHVPKTDIEFKQDFEVSFVMRGKEIVRKKVLLARRWPISKSFRYEFRSDEGIYQQLQSLAAKYTVKENQQAMADYLANILRVNGWNIQTGEHGGTRKQLAGQKFSLHQGLFILEDAHQTVTLLSLPNSSYSLDISSVSLGEEKIEILRNRRLHGAIALIRRPDSKLERTEMTVEGFKSPSYLFFNDKERGLVGFRKQTMIIGDIHGNALGEISVLIADNGAYYNAEDFSPETYKKQKGLEVLEGFIVVKGAKGKIYVDTSTVRGFAYNNKLGLSKNISGKYKHERRGVLNKFHDMQRNIIQGAEGTDKEDYYKIHYFKSYQELEQGSPVVTFAKEELAFVGTNVVQTAYESSRFSRKIPVKVGEKTYHFFEDKNGVPYLDEGGIYSKVSDKGYFALDPYAVKRNREGDYEVYRSKQLDVFVVGSNQKEKVSVYERKGKYYNDRLVGTEKVTVDSVPVARGKVEVLQVIVLDPNRSLVYGNDGKKIRAYQRGSQLNSRILDKFPSNLQAQLKKYNSQYHSTIRSEEGPSKRLRLQLRYFDFADVLTRSNGKEALIIPDPEEAGKLIRVIGSERLQESIDANNLAASQLEEFVSHYKSKKGFYDKLFPRIKQLDAYVGGDRKIARQLGMDGREIRDQLEEDEETLQAFDELTLIQHSNRRTGNYTALREAVVSRDLVQKNFFFMLYSFNELMQAIRSSLTVVKAKNTVVGDERVQKFEAHGHPKVMDLMESCTKFFFEILVAKKRTR